MINGNMYVLRDAEGERERERGRTGGRERKDCHLICWCYWSLQSVRH